MAKIMVHNTRGKEDIERATLACIVGNTALTAGQEAILLLTIDGVWLATKGYTDGLQAEGFNPIGELLANFTRNGGEIWVCGACAKPRNITAEMIVPGAKLVGAAAAVEALVNGAQTLSF